MERVPSFQRRQNLRKMIECPECGAYERSGALYCSECGAFLLDEEAGGAEQQLPFATDELMPTQNPMLLGQDLEPSVGAERITFVIPSSRRHVEMDIKDTINIGRADPADDYQPELDLSEDRGAEHGVSRRHAVIESSPEGVVIIDKDSTNGTLLNNNRLPPDLPYPLRNGDEVKFGQLLVHIFLE